MSTTLTSHRDDRPARRGGEPELPAGAPTLTRAERHALRRSTPLVPGEFRARGHGGAPSRAARHS